jgi:toxin ParE1/3/4
MRYEFHPEALAEFKEAALYYAKRQPGLELRFIECVEDAVERIMAGPTRYRVFADDIRRCLTRVFPYGVLYTVERDFILIVAIMHLSRKPGYWRGRISGNA